MQRLSVVIITYNEEENIGRCIQSVTNIADEIVVVDSGSTDRTASIARNFGAVVYTEKFRGYIEQKNYALQLAAYNNILSLDADEVPDAALLTAIQEAKKSLRGKAYSMNRCTNYCGRLLRHGLCYPDRKIRLFDRRIAKWGGINPHDKIILKKGIHAVHLEGDLLHYAFNSVEELVSRNNRISSIAAQSLYDIGRRSNWYKILVHPAWAFLNGYFLRLGFLDRFEGFSFAVNAAYQVFLKYCKLYRIQRSMKRKSSYRHAKLPLPKKNTATNNV